MEGLEIGQTVYFPGWVLGQGLYVLEGSILALHGRWVTVHVHTRWGTSDAGTSQESWEWQVTVSRAHLRFSLSQLLDYLSEGRREFGGGKNSHLAD